MRLYHAAVSTAEFGTLLFWASSKRGALRLAREWLDENGEADPDPRMLDVYPFDIPTTRAGLVNWLNVHFDRDNG